MTDFTLRPAGLSMADPAGSSRLAFVPDIPVAQQTWTPTEVLDRDGEVLLDTAQLAASSIRFGATLVASVLFGGSNAANSQARYAAADLADAPTAGATSPPWSGRRRSARSSAPTSPGPGEPVAEALGIPALTGPYVFSLLGLVLGSPSSCSPAARPAARGQRRRAPSRPSRPAARLGRPRAADPAGQPRCAARPRDDGPRATRHGQRHGDDPAAHAPRRREPAGHRPRHQHPRAGHVRVLAADRARGRPVGRPGLWRWSARSSSSAAACSPAQAPIGWSAACRRAVPAGPRLVVHAGQRLDPGHDGRAARRAGRRAGRLRPGHGPRPPVAAARSRAWSSQVSSGARAGRPRRRSRRPIVALSRPSDPGRPQPEPQGAGAAPGTPDTVLPDAVLSDWTGSGPGGLPE